MIVGSISENKNIEKRVAITPDVVKKYQSLGLGVHLTKNYALHIGITDKEYELEGAKFFNKDEEVISQSDAILQMNIISDENLDKLKQNQIFIGVLNPFLNEKKLQNITSKKVNCFSLDLLPAIHGVTNPSKLEVTLLIHQNL